MVPKPFRNYPKVEVSGQFFKNSSKGFPDFRWSSQCIFVLNDISAMFAILEGTITNIWSDGMATFQIRNFGRASHIQVCLPDKSKPYLIGFPQFQAFEENIFKIRYIWSIKYYSDTLLALENTDKEKRTNNKPRHQFIFPVHIPVI